MIICDFAILMLNERKVCLVGNEGLGHQAVNQFLMHLSIVEETNTKEPPGIHILGDDSTLLQAEGTIVVNHSWMPSDSTKVGCLVLVGVPGNVLLKFLFHIQINF